MEEIITVFTKNALVAALAVTGLMMYVSHLLSKYLTKGKLQSSAIAITMGLVLAYFGGIYTQGEKGHFRYRHFLRFCFTRWCHDS